MLNIYVLIPFASSIFKAIRKLFKIMVDVYQGLTYLMCKYNCKTNSFPCYSLPKIFTAHPKITLVPHASGGTGGV